MGGTQPGESRMPSRSAHRHALRRSKEPLVIAPPELPDLPLLPDGHGWRNPMRDYHYVRDEWELYRMHPQASITLAVIRRCDSGTYFVRLAGAALAAADLQGTAQEAFDLAARSARTSGLS